MKQIILPRLLTVHRVLLCRAKWLAQSSRTVLRSSGKAFPYPFQTAKSFWTVPQSYVFGKVMVTRQNRQVDQFEGNDSDDEQEFSDLINKPYRQ